MTPMRFPLNFVLPLSTDSRHHQTHTSNFHPNTSVTQQPLIFNSIQYLSSTEPALLPIYGVAKLETSILPQSPSSNATPDPKFSC